MMSISSLGMALLTGAALLVSLAPVRAVAQTVEWSYFTYFPVNDKPAQLTRQFAEDVGKATGGKLKIKVFAAGELPYKAADVVKAVAANQVQMGDVAVGFAAGDVPEINVLSQPFLCTSYDQFERSIPAVAKFADDVMQKRFGITVTVHWTMPPQNLWMSKAAAKIDDIRGMKVRAWNPEQVEMMKALGGSAMSITSAEVIPALERKVIDGAITSALSANDWKAFEIVKSGYMLNLTMGHQIMMVNTAELKKLPADVQQALMSTAASYTAKYRQMSETGDKEARANLVVNKVTLTDPSAEDLAKARQMMRPMWDQWAGKYGDSGKGLLEATMKACGAS